MAPSYIASVVVVLVNLLALIGIEVGSEQLTVTIQTLVAIGGALFVLYRQIKTGRSTISGSRPK